MSQEIREEQEEVVSENMIKQAKELIHAIYENKELFEKIKEGLIFSKTGFRLYRYIFKNYITLEGKFLPLEKDGWGNYEEYIIDLTNDNRVAIEKIRQNWNGTGADTIAHCTLDQSEAQQVREKMLGAKDINDFKALLNNLLAIC